MRSRGSVYANHTWRKFIWGGDEDCLAPLQLSFRGPCSSLAVFGRKAGVIHHLLMELVSDFEAMNKPVPPTNSPPSPTPISISTTPPHPLGFAPFFTSVFRTVIIPVHAQKHISFRAIAFSGKPHEITSKMGLENDTRGWIMTCISGVACVIGASIVCVDIVVRQFPGMEKFSIAESDAFLSASLSLSFGVMVRDPVRMNEHWLILLYSFSPPYTACYQSRRTTLSMAAFLPPQPRTCSSAYS